MAKYINLHKDYTSICGDYQLKLPLNIEYMIPANDSVRLLSQFIEEMDLTDLYSTYSRIRENQATPRQMLKIVLYSYMKHNYSSREIEENCNKNIDFMYLLEGSHAPDHSTFARFRSLHFASCAERIMAQMSNFLYEIGEVMGNDIFIDGTKIEACANKYTFVWRKAVSKNLEKLLSKLADFVAECEESYGIKIVYENKVKAKHIKKLRKKLYALKQKANIEFVHGCGKKKSPIQRSIEKLEEYLQKLKEYTKKIHICGKRNSYSKTDKDATFMRMKEDAMKNGQLKPAYNLQHGIDSEYIVWLTVGYQPTDTTTLIPFIKSMENFLNFKYLNIVADSGYESEENYVYVKGNLQSSFIKPANYEISKTRKYQNDISRIENMEYNKFGDYYICKNNKRLSVNRTIKRKSKTGYESEKTIYTSQNCKNCEFKNKCIKGHNCKTSLEDRVKNIETSKLFNELRKENLERIVSEEGCKLRMNRSIQVEGSFGEIKQDMGFRRYLSKGQKNVLAESILLAMAHNVNKLHNKIQSDRIETHLFPLKQSV
jgi:transposase